MIALALPWPSRTLHPNSRKHWAIKAKAAKAARQTAGWIAKEAGIRPGDPDIPDALKVNIVFFPPNARAHDLDGCLSALKSSLDGIADALGTNDSKWQIAIRKDAPVKGGSVRIELEQA